MVPSESNPWRSGEKPRLRGGESLLPVSQWASSRDGTRTQGSSLDI